MASSVSNCYRSLSNGRKVTAPMGLRAVLFDLDCTLLQIDLPTFLQRYYDQLAQAISASFPGTPSHEALTAATRAMTRPHPGATNTEAFYRTFEGASGLDRGKLEPVIEHFCREVHPDLRNGATGFAGTPAALACALGLGLRVAIATNPIFPRASIRQRLAWAGIDADSVDLVTDADNMNATKPSPEYYLQVAGMLSVKPRECMMVGDDRSMDLPAADVGMTTFYVGDSTSAVTHHRGDLPAFVDILPRLADVPPARSA